MSVLPLAAVGALSSRLSAQLNRPAPEIVEGPTEWVAFQALVRVSHPGAPVIQGRFFRSSNGSERLETGPSLDDIRVVSIKNVLQGFAYDGLPRLNKWRRVSWTSRTGGKPPVTYRSPAWSIHPYRLALKKGQSGALDATEGFTAYSFRQGSGGVTLKVPELNFFEVVRQRPDGRYEIYSEIELVEPDWQLFELPLDAIVTDEQMRTPPVGQHHLQ